MGQIPHYTELNASQMPGDYPGLGGMGGFGIDWYINSLLTSNGCFIRLKKQKQKKIVLYLQMFQHTKLYLSFSKISASAFILKYS